MRIIKRLLSIYLSTSLILTVISPFLCSGGNYPSCGGYVYGVSVHVSNLFGHSIDIVFFDPIRTFEVFL